MTIFQVAIPDEVLPVIEMAAGEEGWTATVDDGNGNPIPNPISAMQALFLKVVRMAETSAVNATVRNESANLVSNAESQIGPLIQAWIAANQG